MTPSEHNKRILEQMRGMPAQSGTSETDADPRNPNIWRPIATAPRDGTWFLICRAGEGFDSYEVGCFDPSMHDHFEPAGDGLYRKVQRSIYDWRGFNNFHRATHWMPLPAAPVETS